MLSPDQLRERVRTRLREQRTLVQALLRQRDQLQGSLFARYGRCGKEGCACRAGRGHGPYYVLSTRSAGQGGFVYLDGDQAARARELMRRQREFRTGLRRLRALNLELVTLLRRYQQALLRKGQKRLSVGATL